jgi:hypothetical protein
VQNQKAPQFKAEATKPSVVPSGIKENVPTPLVAKDQSLDLRPKELSVPIRHRKSPGNLLTGNVSRVKNSPELDLKPSERREALIAKGQLMMALRLASEKLNLAQRRTQLSSPANLLRNQHKVG